MRNYILEFDNKNFFDSLKENFKMCEIDEKTAFIYCDTEDLRHIKTMNGFVSVFPDAESAINEFKF